MAWRPTAEYLADEGRNIFIGPMNGGLWNGRILDACIMSKKAAAVLSEASSPARNPNLHDYSCVSFVVPGLNKSIGTCGIRGI